MWVTVWLVVASLCGVIGGMYSWSKGQSAVGGIVLGFMFGPFGIAYIAVVPRLDDKIAQRSGLHQCPQCAEWIRPEAQKCRYCQSTTGSA